MLMDKMRQNRTDSVFGRIRKEMIGMKKFINAPEDVERQVVDGYVKAYPGKIAKAADDIVVRAHAKRGKVALVSGGGMGHEPAHLGFVGTGMLDAAVGGAVFTSPAVDRVDEGVCKVAAGNTGVLLVIENYTGDVVNFKMAEQNAREDGIDVDHVIADDDVAVKDLLYTVGRRGVAGTVLVHKCAGAMAETGAPLAEVKRVAQKVIDNVRTMGVAIEPCTVPAAGKPGFTLADDEMEMGVGIHGEPGVRRAKMEPVDAMVDEMLDTILSDLDYAGRDVAVLVNDSGATPPYELAIINNRVHDVLAERGVHVWRTFMGPYMTSLEMRGFSLTLLRLDDELKGLLDAPADAPAWTQGTVAENADEGVAAEPVATDEQGTTPAGKPEADVAAPADPETRLVSRVLASVADTLDAHKDELTQLDMPIGDSDHGINMACGFDAVRDLLPELAGKDAPAVLKKAGMTVISKVGGSSGPLYGTILRKLGVAVKRAKGLTLASFADGLEAGFAGIRDLAGAQLGDKTMLDAMRPAIDAVKAGAEAGEGAATVLDRAAQAAADGAEATVPLIAKKGRASYLGERSVGHKDPGAASFAYCMAAVAEAVKQAE